MRANSSLNSFAAGNPIHFSLALLVLLSLADAGQLLAQSTQTLAQVVAATIHEQAKLTPSEGTVGGDGEHGLDSGAAYVFAFDGTTWNEEAKLIADDEEAGDFFGTSISLSGTRALIGAMKNSSDGPSAAYLFFFDGGQWNQQQEFIPSDGPVGDFNTVSISLSGKRVLLGTTDSAGNNGAAYVFGRGSQRQ